jgi:hypothetical protein
MPKSDLDPAREAVNVGLGIDPGYSARMQTRRALVGLTLLAALAAACGTPVPPTPPPTGVTALAVAQVENKTGSALVVSGDNFVAKYLGRKKRTVPDVMRDNVRDALRERGFAVADGGAVPTLSISLSRFEPDQPALAYVEVALTATLKDPDGTVRWSTERSHWLVSTRGAPTLEAAYEDASKRAAAALVETWSPAS